MFDINAKLGHWPYRPVRGLDALLRTMDAYGIEQAAVSSLSAVHFLNPQDGNDELATLIAPHRDRLVPFAVLRPDFAGREDDLRRCLCDYEMKGIVLYPNYHEFSLADPSMVSFMAFAEQYGVLVCVQAGLEDVRRQFRPYKTADVPANDIGDLARAWPSVSVIAFGLKFGQPEQMGEPLPGNLYFDTSNYETLGELECAVKRFGSDRVLFGTNFPLFNPRANVDKIRRSALDEEQREAIARQNALRLLRI